jgi:hypothetical protein
MGVGGGRVVGWLPIVSVRLRLECNHSITSLEQVKEDPKHSKKKVL